MAKKVNKPMAYSWVAYMVTHAPEEMARVRKYGTPSDELIRLAEKPTAMILKSGEVRSIFFPISLNTNRGQKLLFEILKHVDLHIKALPIKAYELFQHVKKTVSHRRKDTVANLHMVAEAIIHRAACEYKTEVIFAFDSINTWIEAKYSKVLGYLTLRKALELLEQAGILRVVEWGTKNVRHRATKIEIIPVARKTELTYSAEIDDWLLFSDHAMVAVYKRESVARQDVLEVAIHSHIESISASEMTAKIDRVLLQGAFFKRADSTVTIEVRREEVSDDYFARLLGELVQPLHKNDPTGREASYGIRTGINSS